MTHTIIHPVDNTMKLIENKSLHINCYIEKKQQLVSQKWILFLNKQVAGLGSLQLLLELFVWSVWIHWYSSSAVYNKKHCIIFQG